MAGVPQNRRYRERIEAVLRGAAWEGEAWVPYRSLVEAVSPENLKSFATVLWNMERGKQLRVDRSLGYHVRRFALFTPEELELLFTWFRIYAEKANEEKGGEG